jgi:hypothetical protein
MWLGACLADQGRFDESEALLLETYKTLRETRGLKNRLVQANLVHVIALYDAWGRPDEAAEYRTLRRKASSPTFFELVGLRNSSGGPFSPPVDASP